MSGSDRSTKRHTLSTNGESKRQILDIATGENGAVLGFKRSTNLEIRIGGICAEAYCFGGSGEWFVVHAKPF
jgi:hypothetical protein